MTDRDVVEHAARLVGRPVWRSDRGLELGYKSAFLTSLKGAGAVQLMEKLRPVMGSRRQAQIDRALARPHQRRMRWYRRASACSVTACPRPVRVRGLCKDHYNSWWKSKKRGRVPRYVPIDPPGPASIDHIGPLAVPETGTSAAIAWLAGLLEGEGTFEAHGQRDRIYPRISLHMCDEDVVRRASVLLGARSIWPEEAREEGWRPTFGTGKAGSGAVAVMFDVRAFMGERRTREIDLALSSYRPERLTQVPEICVVPACDGSPRGRGLCHRHYMTWTRDRAKGREPRVKPRR